MKKILKYIGIIGLISFASISNIGASTIDVEDKPGHKTSFGYSTQTQTLHTASCTYNIYCIDKGLSNQENFDNCSISDVSNTAFGQVSGDHDQKEYQYRVIAYNSGLSAKGATIPTSVLNPAAYGYGNLKTASVSSSQMNTVGGEVSYTSSQSNGMGTINATVKIGQAGYASKFYANKGNLSVSDLGNGSYKLTITQIPIAKCKGANVIVKLRGINSIDKNNGSVNIPVAVPGTVYYVDCHNSAQNYILEVPNTISTPGAGGSVTCDINDITKNAAGGVKFEFSIPDEECDCKGTTTMSGQCDTSGETKDLEKDENLKSCIKEGGFAEYCNTNLQKKVDNGSKATSPVLSDTRSSKTNVSEGLSDSNPYCKVYCLENIAYDLPGTIKTESGSYFKLKKGWNKVNDSGTNMKITGTRTCYTSEIDKSRYIDDVKSKQNEIKDNWNQYQYDKAKKDAIENKAKYKKESTMNCGKESVQKTDANGKKMVDKSGNPIMVETDKSVKYYYYEANLKYKCEKGQPLGDGQWKSNPDECNSTYTWGAPTCENGELKYPEDEKIDLNTSWRSLLIELGKIINKYKACTEWNNYYCFDPNINFSYDEVYNSMVSGNIDKTVSEVSNNTTYYTSVDDSYKTGAVTSGNKETKSYILVKENSSLTQTSSIDMTSLYVKQEITKEATFKDATKEIFTYHPYGTIVIDPNSVADKGNLVSLGYAFPIALQHDPDTGIYNYYLAISNIGVGGNDTSCEYTNKIIGESCSIFNTKNEATPGKEYVCQYQTESCPECEVECKCPENKPNCYVEDKVCKFITCDDCSVKCVGCLWNNGDSTFAYKQVSVSDVFPNSTDNKDVGYNWNTDSTINTNAQKAEATITDIERNAQKVYEKAEYSYTLTPTIMGKIRNYNEESNKDTQSSIKWANKYEIPKGGYNNDTLTCTNGIRCTSSFLDGLDDIVGKNNRTRNDQWEEYNGSAWK